MINDGPQNIQHAGTKFNYRKIDFYIKSGSGPHIIRNIFENVEYDEYEKKQILLLQQALLAQQIKSNLKQSGLLKMLIVAQYDIQKAVDNCIEHMKFVKKYNELDMVEQLNQGTIYSCGYDKQFRPVIIINNFISIQLVAYFFETVKRIQLIDYYVENWTVIFDLEKELPVLDVEDLLYLQLHFCGNLNKILIINTPEDITSIIKEFTDKFTYLQSKVKIILEHEELQQFIQKEQIEQKYGGDLPNQEIFWPIQRRDTLSIYIPKTSHLSIGSLLDHSPRKSSYMKITVLEENGNALHDEQVEVFDEEQQDQKQTLKQESKSLKSKSYQSKSFQSSTSQKQLQFEENDLIPPQDEEMKKESLKYSLRKLGGGGGETKTTMYTRKQTVMEGEKDVPHNALSCCSRSCAIF